jgi:hypothetical protein
MIAIASLKPSYRNIMVTDGIAKKSETPSKKYFGGAIESFHCKFNTIPYSLAMKLCGCTQSKSHIAFFTVGWCQSIS